MSKPDAEGDLWRLKIEIGAHNIDLKRLQELVDWWNSPMCDDKKNAPAQIRKYAGQMAETRQKLQAAMKRLHQLGGSL